MVIDGRVATRREDWKHALARNRLPLVVRVSGQEEGVSDALGQQLAKLKQPGGPAFASGPAVSGLEW